MTHKLIIRKVRSRSHFEHISSLHERVEARQFRASWNFSINALTYGRMEFEEKDGFYTVFMMFPSEDKAALFKLTHL